MSEAEMNSYRLTSMEETGDERMAQIMREVAEDARESTRRAEIIVGTSLGGWMAVMCDSGDAEIVIVNPSVNPVQTLGRWVGQELPYFCRRLDGEQTYTLTSEVLDKYNGFDFSGELQRKVNRVHALCSSNDELIGDIHITPLRPLLDGSRLTVRDDFGHRCSGRGMHHLFEILDWLTASH